MTTNIRPLAPELGAAMLLNRAIEVLGPRLAERASHYDAHDAFVAENFAELKAFGVFAAAVPQELGGAGASLDRRPVSAYPTVARYSVRASICTKLRSAGPM